MSDNSAPTAEECAIWDAGERIAAIKAYRQRVGCNLVEAMCAFDEEAAARHRLHAAAPDLLEELKFALSCFEDLAENVPGFVGAKEWDLGLMANEIRAAIAKAEGRS